MTDHFFSKLFSAIITFSLITSCVSSKVHDLDSIQLHDQDSFTYYQKSMADKAPAQRSGTEGIDSLVPEHKPEIPELPLQKDESTGKAVINLSIDDAVLRVLSNSPEISVVSFDPSIAGDEIVKEASQFDVTTFAQYSYEEENNETDSIFEGGNTRMNKWEAGIKQRGTTGAEWSLAYSLERSWDNSLTRNLFRTYEPIIVLQLKQPLLRDAWSELNLAGFNIARLNYEISLAAFRKRSEEITTEVVSLYWLLLQARHDLEIQQELLEKTFLTLHKVEARKNIDATTTQIKQVEASLKSRMAELFEAEKRSVDVQDALVRLLSDHQMNLLGDFEIIPSTPPDIKEKEFVQLEIMKQAVSHNPQIQQARLGMDIANINLKIAKKQKMPRLDLVASTKLTGLGETQEESHDVLFTNKDTPGYAVGVVLEYPLGNRERKAEYHRRKLEHSKALSTLQNLSDQVAAQARERIRLAEKTFKGIHVQQAAVKAARIYLDGMEVMESITEKLTPQFLLTKLTAQETLANSQRAEIKAIVDYNIALIKIAQTTGTVFDIRYIKTALPDSYQAQQVR